MRTSQQPHDLQFSFKASGLLTLLHRHLDLVVRLQILHGR